MAEGTVHGGSAAKLPTKPKEEQKLKNVYYLKQIKICAEYRDMIPRARLDFRVHLGFGLSASAQVPDKPALVWVACPCILHRS